MTASARRGPFGRDSSNLCLHRGLDGCRYRTCVAQDGGAILLGSSSTAILTSTVFKKNSATSDHSATSSVSLSPSLSDPSLLWSISPLLSFFSPRIYHRCSDRMVQLLRRTALATKATDLALLQLYRWWDGRRFRPVLA